MLMYTQRKTEDITILQETDADTLKKSGVIKITLLNKNSWIPIAAS